MDGMTVQGGAMHVRSPKGGESGHAQKPCVTQNENTPPNGLYLGRHLNFLRGNLPDRLVSRSSQA